jgi:hypothetical protein
MKFEISPAFQGWDGLQKKSPVRDGQRASLKKLRGMGLPAR